MEHTPSTGESPQEPKVHVKVSQAETKRLLAILAHLNQISRASVRNDKFIRPTEMDQAELLLAAASLRALFFDDTPKPMLVSFLEENGLEIEIEAIESNLGLILLSQLLPEPGHISDHLAAHILDPELREQFPAEREHESFIFYTDRIGLESMAKRPELWAPNREQDTKINSGLTSLTNGGPAQMLWLCRRRVSLADWGKVRVGYLKDKPINRRNLVSYVANKLGGVHYDSKRTPRNLDDAEQFAVLATGYDWDDMSLMHAGLVAVALACIEVIAVPEIRALRHDFKQLLEGRQRRLTEIGMRAVALSEEADKQRKAVARVQPSY